MRPSPPTPATAYFNQRAAVAASSGRLRALREAIADPVNLASFQWAQLFAYAREYRPDLILELGRGHGNSTAAFGQALHELGHGRLISFCLSRDWDERTKRKIAPLVEADWFDRIETRTGNMLGTDFGPLLGPARRVLVFWDAHGFEIAELVLGHVLPQLADREHFVAMHDISDARYQDRSILAYGERRLWQGMHSNYRNQNLSYCHLGWVQTQVDQAVAAIDFLTRNAGELRSADDSLHKEIGADAARLDEIKSVMPAADFSLGAHWAYFSLNDLPGPYTFPRYAPESVVLENTDVRAIRTRDLLKIVAGRVVRKLSGRRYA